MTRNRYSCKMGHDREMEIKILERLFQEGFMDRMLSEYMQGLPMHVRTLKDAKRMALKHSCYASPSDSRSEIKKAISLMHPNENIYFIEWLITSNIFKTENGRKMEDQVGGLIFFSDTRFVCICGMTERVYETPLSEIQTVAAKRNDIVDGDLSFRTYDRTFEIKGLIADDINMVREMLIHLSAFATGSEFGDAERDESDTSSGGRAQVLECLGCGATVIFHSGAINKCEYCGRLVQEATTVQETATVQEMTAAQPAFGMAAQDTPPLGLADELKKYNELLQMGALSNEEFEHMKRQLLSGSGLHFNSGQ